MTGTRRTLKLGCFFVFYSFSILVETILFSYILSAYYSIERQFQIPEKTKSTSSLVAARNVGFLVSALILSYLGSRGNRMRWIGAAGVLMTIGCIIVAIPSFAFPKHELAPNASIVRDYMRSPAYQKFINATPEELMDFPLIKAKLPSSLRKTLTDKLNQKEGGFMGYDDDDEYGNYGDYTDEIPEPPPRPKKADPVKSVLEAEKADTEQQTEAEKNETEGTVKRRVRRDGPPHPDVERKMIKASMQDVMDAGLDLFLGDMSVLDFFEVVRKKIITPPEVLIGMLNRGAGYGFGPCNSIVNDMKPVVQALKCSNTDTQVGAYVLVLIGLLAVGIGHALPWVLGLPLIDDNFSKRTAPICFGVLFWFQTLGPVLAMLIGSVFCRKNYTTLVRPNLSAIDPRWIGAWWLGFLVIGAVILIPSILILALLSRPSKQKGKEGRYEENGSAVSIALLDQYNARTPASSVLGDLKGFLNGIVRILRSRTYVATLIARILDVMSLGAIVYLRKYADMEFGLNEKKATLVLALLGMAGFGVGSILGGILMGRLRLEGRKMALWVVVCSLLIACLFFSRMAVRCHSPVDVLNEEGLKNGFNYTSECNSYCSCDKVDTFPVCDEAGVPYYSPCIAGCTDMIIIDKANFKVNFTKCSCVKNPEKLPKSLTVSRDLCVDECSGPFIGFRAVAVIGGFFMGLLVVPAFLILLRSVPPELRSLAIGFKAFLLMLLGAIPAVYLFSAVTEASCLHWKEDCHGDASCMVYDTEGLRIRVNIWAGALRILATIFDLFVWMWAADLRIFTPNLYEPGVELGTLPQKNGTNDVILLDAKRRFDDEDD